MKKNLSALLFLGAAWGICEAGIGYALHRMAVLLPGLPGALMFPIGFYWMNKAQKATGEISAPLCIAAIAATIKLADFLIPGADPIRVINPSLSILMEGLAVTAVYALGMRKRISVFIKVLGMGIIWRGMFAVYLYGISLIDLPALLVTSGIVTLLRFVLLESFINSLVILACIHLASRLPRQRPRPISPLAASAAILFALSLQVLL